MTQTRRSLSLRFPSSNPIRMTLLGQLIGILGLVVLWINHPEIFTPPGFPPGIVWILGATAIVWVDQHSTWSPVAAGSLAIWIIGGGFLGAGLADDLASGDLSVIVPNMILIIGLSWSAVWSIVAIVHNRRRRVAPEPRPISKANPNRTMLLVTVAGLVATGVGDGAPEGLNWDGPGPVMFLALGMMVAFIPGRFMLLLAVILSGTFLFAAFSNPESYGRLTTPSEPIGFGFGLLQVTGLAVAIVAGIWAMKPDPAPATDAVGR